MSSEPSAPRAAARRLALIGCGLMGGSFAMALRRAMQGHAEPAPLHITGYSRSRSSAQRGLELGIIDSAHESAAAAVEDADVVLLAVPVTATESTLAELLPALSVDALIMDVGSTKRDVVASARAALAGPALRQFVPCHPIAGKETGGIDQADALLYQARRCIITPLADNTPPLLQRAQRLWELVGCSVVQMSAEQHDRTFAAVSHLPHLLAFAFVNGVAQQPDAARHLALAGPGFRDFSRIASGTSAIWRDIFSANRDEVLAQLSHFEAALAAMRTALADGDDAAVARLVDAASAVRAHWTLNGTTPPSDDPA